MDNEACYNCRYETGADNLDAMGYCYNCQMAYEVGHEVGFMSALQQLAGKNPSELANLDKLSGDERYTLFARLLNE
jgi:hypothetical protein